jgi:hypothetical protein
LQSLAQIKQRGFASGANAACACLLVAKARLAI